MTPLALWLLAAVAGADGATTAPVDCAAGEDRAPDPRCGESLDGRGPPPPAPAVTRAALAVPRVAARVAFWPVVHTTELVERYQLIDWMDAVLTTDDGLIGVRPIIHYSTSFLPSGGLRFFDDRLPGAGTEIAGQFQTAGPDVLWSELDLRAPAWTGLSLVATWNRRYDRLFAGIGPRSLADLDAAGQQIARYGSDNTAAELRWMRVAARWMTAYAKADVQRRDYTAARVVGGPSVNEVFAPPEGCAALGLPAGCVDPAILPGFAKGLRLAHVGGTLGLGLREPGRERPGAVLLVGATVAQGLAGDPSRHATFSGEGVVAVGGPNRAVIVRGRAAMVERLGSAPIPFEELISPSGDTGMRGFPDGRFRGQSGLVGTAEYRWYIAAYLDATLFTDVGTVAGRAFTDIDWGRWFPTFGLGFRLFRTPNGPYWAAEARDEVQIAYAPDNGVRLLLTVTAF